ncbi:MAG: tRNA (guanosine(37)-N1)-methyltransferase TrmD [Nitrospirae bacterium]|nr:tRNA (guanosine(37)-N1)-methyltransferase TrmD [Nitrospirota bacterium]
MKAKIVTLFPEMIRPVLRQSILKRAIEGKFLEVEVLDLRDFSRNKHCQVDDAPYGGGAGMVISSEPVFELFESIKSEAPFRTILLSPGGRPFNQNMAEALSRETKCLLFLCGHYEGIDERVRVALQPEEISVGDYILTGGELPALILLDAITRLIPGVLGDQESLKEESFNADLLEYPHYTRPFESGGIKVPAVLLSGNHEEIRRWRLKESLRKTLEQRPELLEQKELTPEEKSFLDELKLEKTSDLKRV